MNRVHFLCPEMPIIRCMLHFDKRPAKCSVKCLSVNHLVVTLGLAFVFGLPFRLGLGLLLCLLEEKR